MIVDFYARRLPARRDHQLPAAARLVARRQARGVLAREMIELFSLERVNKAPASFDPQKLWAFQDRHMRGVPVENKVPAALAVLCRRPGSSPAPPPAGIGPYLARVIAAAGDRIKTMGDILQFREFFVADDELPHERARVRQSARKRRAPSRCCASSPLGWSPRARSSRRRSSRSSRRSSPSATSRSASSSIRCVSR